VSSDKLNVKECEIYRACVQWATAKCVDYGNDEHVRRLRQVLGDVVYDIRIPLMTQEELETCVEDCDILFPNERENISLYFTNPGSAIVEFETRPREMVAEVRQCLRFAETLSGWGVGRNAFDTIDVSCTSNMAVKGVLVYGGIGNKSTHYVTVKIRDENLTLLGEGNGTITSDGSDLLHTVMLTDVAQLTKNVLYTVSVEMDGCSHTWYGTNGIEDVEGEFGTISFRTSALGFSGSNGTCTTQGQIPGLLLFSETGFW
jgi:hypothetical protein